MADPKVKNSLSPISLFDEPVFRSLSSESSSNYSSLTDSPKFRSLSAEGGLPGFLPVPLVPDKAPSSKGWSLDTKSIGVSSLMKGMEALSIDQEPIVIEPPESPDERFLEPNSTFYTNKPFQFIFSAISHFLQRNKIDHHISIREHSIKGVLYGDDGTTNFQVALFRGSIQKYKYVVEVQRRFGSVVTFRNFYQQLISALGENAISRVSMNEAAPIVPGLGQVLLDSATVDALLKSALSTSVEKKHKQTLEHSREIFRTLASLSNTTHNQTAFVASAFRQTLGDVIVQSLQSEDREVRRCGSVLAANIVQQSEAQTMLVAKVVPKIFEVLGSEDEGLKPEFTGFGLELQSLIEKEIQRRLMSVVAALTISYAKEIAKTVKISQHLNMFSKLQSSPDETLRSSATDIVTRLSSASK